MNRYVDESGKPIIRSTLLSMVYSDDKFDRSDKVKFLFQGGEITGDNMVLGSLAHMFLFQPHLVKDTYVCYTGNKTSKSYKEMVDRYPGRIPVKICDYHTARNMSRVVGEFVKSDDVDPVVRELISGGNEVYFEEEIEFDRGGYKEVIRPDSHNHEYFLDYKTTSKCAVNQEIWHEHIVKYNMHVQLGFYFRLLAEKQMELYGYERIKGAYHLVQSTVPPYSVSVFFFPKSSLENVLDDIDACKLEVLSRFENMRNKSYIQLESIFNFNQIPECEIDEGAWWNDGAGFEDEKDRFYDNGLSEEDIYDIKEINKEVKKGRK